MIIENVAEFNESAKAFFTELRGEALFDEKLGEAFSHLHSRSVPIKAIVVVGCGGTGSWLFPKLVKTINDADRKGLLAPSFTLIAYDGDICESKNLVRQNFIEHDINKNKAQVMVERYAPHINDRYQKFYIDKYVTTKEQLADRPVETHDRFMTIEDLGALECFSPNHNLGDVIIFNLVDNTLARKAIHALPKCMPEDNRVYIVDTGNDMYNGQFFVSEYHSGLAGENTGRGRQFMAEKAKSFVESYMNANGYFGAFPEQLELSDDVSLYSCAEADVDIDNQDQMLVANDFAATICHNWFVNHALNKMSKTINFTQKYSDFICGNSSTMTVKDTMINSEMAKLYLVYGLFTGKYNIYQTEEGTAICANEDGKINYGGVIEYTRRYGFGWSYTEEKLEEVCKWWNKDRRALKGMTNMQDFGYVIFNNENFDIYRSLNFTGMSSDYALNYRSMLDYIGDDIDSSLKYPAYYFDCLVRSLIAVYYALGRSARENTLTLGSFIKLAEIIVKKNAKK